MKIQSQRPKPACFAHARHICVCIGLALLPALQARGETLNSASYDSWRWNGFAQFVSSQSQSSSNMSVMLENPASQGSTAGSAASSGKSGASSYSKWQYGGFSRSYSSASSIIDTSPPQSSPNVSLLRASLMADEGQDEAFVPNSLSGYVFFDENANGKMDYTDWAILDVKLKLTLQDNGASWSTYTDSSNGYFIFDGLVPGTYGISLLTEFSKPGLLIMGQLYDAQGQQLPNPGEQSDNGFINIVLENGDFGINYAFCESEYPVGAVSKRLLISGGPKHTVPEPATFALLAIAGLMLGASSLRRK
ncbi:MAG: PEP-CTERM sorting domain-containing protein [Pirellulaceae bacterium]|nr:PEP-CTERM sorting domain-containing protein [Pirellulaceae bacterium]